MSVVERYKGVQTFLQEGCYFLSLCSIAEEMTGRQVDLLDEIAQCKKKGLVGEDAYVRDPCSVLRDMTGKQWKLEVKNKVPEKVPDEMYTVLKYKNEKTGYTHFKRRYFDTLLSSKTVVEGKIVGCYCFTVAQG